MQIVQSVEMVLVIFENKTMQPNVEMMVMRTVSLKEEKIMQILLHVILQMMVFVVLEKMALRVHSIVGML